SGPKIAPVAGFHEPGKPNQVREMKELPADARVLQLTIQPWQIGEVDDFEKVFAALNKQRPDGLYSLGGGRVIRPNEKRIVGFALKSRLPSMHSNREIVEAGGLMSYGATNRTAPGGPHITWTESLREPSPLICPSSSRQSSSW